MRLAAFGVSCVILAALYLVLHRTRLGRAIRATVQNPTSARLLGVDAERVSAYGFGLSVATATAAGAVFGMVEPFNPGSHYDLISRLLTIIVLGGLGSLTGRGGGGARHGRVARRCSRRPSRPPGRRWCSSSS